MGVYTYIRLKAACHGKPGTLVAEGIEGNGRNAARAPRAGGRKGDLSRFVQEAVQARLEVEMRAAGKQRPEIGSREGLAEALAEIRARTQTLSKSRFEKLVTEAVAYARKRR